MPPPPTAQTNPEVDRIVEKMTRWLAATPPEATKPFPLTRAEVQWVLAEIEGGREAFGGRLRKRNLKYVKALAAAVAA